MRKILAAILVATFLTGCATHQQSNQLAGAAVGGIIGNRLGGSPGAVIGTVIGSEIGRSQPTQPPAVSHYPPVIVHQHYYSTEICRTHYEKRIHGCDLKFRNDPNYSRFHRDSCINDAKYQYRSCVYLR